MPRQHRHALERGADDACGEMSAPVARAGVPDMLVTLVDDVEFDRRQFGFEPGADRIDARTHGSTRRNGRISTSRYTSAAT